MRVLFHVPREMGRERRTLEWPKDWPPPHAGEEIVFAEDAKGFIVSHVNWYPEGDPFGYNDPHVYVILREIQ